MPFLLLKKNPNKTNKQKTRKKTKQNKTTTTTKISAWGITQITLKMIGIESISIKRSLNNKNYKFWGTLLNKSKICIFLSQAIWLPKKAHFT